MSLYFLRSPQVMKGLHFSTDGSQMQLTLLSQQSKESTVLVKADYQPQTSTLEAWKDLSPLSINKDSLVHLLKGSLPLHLQQPQKNYSCVYLSKEKTVYVQFNRTQNRNDTTFAAFITEIRKTIKKGLFSKFVLDLRYNTGGDNGLAAKALEELGKDLHGKKAFIITGPATFSAGIVCAAIFKKFASATIIGEPAGDGLVFLSEGGNVVFPYSGLNAHYANGFHNWIFEDNFSIDPDVSIPMDFESYRKGEDPVMNYILKN